MMPANARSENNASSHGKQEPLSSCSSPFSIDAVPSLELSTTMESSVSGSSTTPCSKLLRQLSPSHTSSFQTPQAVERAVGPPVPSPPTKRSSPERALDTTREISCMYSRVFTDANDLLPFGVAPNFHDATEVQARLEEISTTLTNKAVSLQIELLVRINRSCPCAKREVGEGQAFLLEGVDGRRFVVSVKHNFCSEVNKTGEFEECRTVWIVLPNSSFVLPVPYGNSVDLLSWDADAHTETFFPSEWQKTRSEIKADRSNQKAWKYGIEIMMLPVEEWEATIHPSGLSPHYFETVNESFQIETGMLVGIMACSTTGLLAESMKESLPKSESYEYQPSQGDIFITVGEITCVGINHIEYNVNTVHGFSGAPVFLLCPGEENHMKVIAVHAGHSMAVDRNFAFRLTAQN